MKQSEEKRPLERTVVEGNILLIYTLTKRKQKFATYNVHLIPTFKKSFIIISSVNFLLNLRMFHVIDGNITFYLVISPFVHLKKARK